MGAPSDATLVSRRFRILVPLRHRDFRFLWSGMTVSLLGDGITTIALAWQAYELSNAPTALAVIGVAQTIPHVLLLLVGGAVSDRFERRKVLIAADTVRMLAVCALGVLAVSGHIQIWHMMLIAALLRRRERLLRPRVRRGRARSRARRRSSRRRTRSTSSSARPCSACSVRRAAAGSSRCSVVARGPRSSSTPPRSSCPSSACSRSAVARRRRRDGETTTCSIGHEIAEGLRYVRTRVWLWGTFLAATLAYLIFWGPAGSARAVRRQGRDGSGRGSPRSGVRVRRHRRDVRRDRDVEPRAPPTVHDVHVRRRGPFRRSWSPATGWRGCRGS